MARTEKGDRKAQPRVRIVEYQKGRRITMFFDEYRDPGPINFNATSGKSGPRAYETLRKILDAEEAKESDA